MISGLVTRGGGWGVGGGKDYLHLVAQGGGGGGVRLLPLSPSIHLIEAIYATHCLAYN